MRPLSPPRDTRRELWLADAARLLVREFDLTVPPLVIRTDVAMRGNTGPAVGLCWDDNPECRIDIAAELVVVSEILAVLHHELVHAEAGPLLGHNGAYRPLFRAQGFVGPFVGYATSPALARHHGRIARQLGGWPKTATFSDTPREKHAFA